VFVGGARVGGGGLVADGGGPESKASALRPASTIAVLGRAAHHRHSHEEARLERLGRGAVAVEVAAIAMRRAAP
jgi:hypothetical protein